MTKTIFEFVVFMTVSLCLQNDLGVSFQMEISPGTVSGLLHMEVSIECRLDSSDNNVKEIMILDVAKGGNQIAVIHQTHKVSVAKGLKGNVKAEGSLSTSDVNKSYLRVTLTSPQKEDAGLYKCQLYYLDNEGLVKDVDTSATLTVTTDYDDQVVKSTLRYLADKVSSLETEMAGQRSEATNAKIRLDQLEQCASNQTDLRGQIVALTDQLQSQQKEIQDLKQSSTNQHSRDMFKAVFGKKDTWKEGDVIVFSHVIFNEGLAFDRFKGVFTAPVAGYYVFHLSVMLDSENEYIYIDLKTDKSRILKRIEAAGYSYADYTDGTCLAKLEAGEQVKPVVYSLPENKDVSFNIINEGINDHINMFSGYLLKAV